jgi:prevent-host-death family protein
MTMMTIKTKWSVAEAKARFSELIDRASRGGPQTVTRNGRVAAVVVSSAEWERKTKRTGSLADFLAESPLRGSRLRVPPRAETPRKVKL